MSNDQFINSFNQLSRLIWILLFATLIFNVYLVQRSVGRSSFWSNLIETVLEEKELAGDDQNPIKQNPFLANDQSQGSIYGLKINYTTLTILWPVVIMTCYLVILFQLRKRERFLNWLIQESQIENLNLLNYDFYSLTTLNARIDKKLFFTLLQIIPTIGMAFHVYLGIDVLVFIANAFEEEVNNPGSAVDFVYYDVQNLFYIQLPITILCLALSLIINTKSLKSIQAQFQSVN